jgi:hypothetical protein
MEQLFYHRVVDVDFIVVLIVRCCLIVGVDFIIVLIVRCRLRVW